MIGCKNTGSLFGYYVGGLIGFKTSGPGTIENSTNSGLVGGTVAGGLVGYALSLTIIHCNNTGQVTGFKSSGGLVGDTCKANITDSHNTAPIKSHTEAGGLGGFIGSQGTVINCSNTGDISASRDAVGGLFGSIAPGSDTFIMDNCKNTGSVVCNSYCGGLIGKNNTIQNVTHMSRLRAVPTLGQ